jgi:hypothetical protein
MKRNLGKFKTNNYQSGGIVDDPGSTDIIDSSGSTPPVMGAPMPSPNAKSPVLGQIAKPQQDITPKQYAGEVASRKRMQKMPSQPSLGPITGGLKTMGQGAPQPMQGQQASQQASLGDRWMGEIWQDLTSEDQVEQTPGLSGVGYAHGGSVDRGMEIYNQTMKDLEVGGIGYARGGMVEQSDQIASMGRNGDTMLMHINPAELQGLQSLLGPVSVNPETGNPEAWAWLIPLVGAALGSVAGGVASDWDLGPTLAGAGMGAFMGLGAMGGAAGAAPAAAATAAPTTVAPAATAAGTAATTAGTTAGGFGSVAIPSLNTAVMAKQAAAMGPIAKGFVGTAAGTTKDLITQAAFNAIAPSAMKAGGISAASPGIMSTLGSTLGKAASGPGADALLQGLGSVAGPGDQRPAPPPPVSTPSRGPAIDPRQFLKKPTMPRMGMGLPGSRKVR